MSNRFEMRCDDAFAERLDQWRRHERDLPNRSETVRRLVYQGLKYDDALALLRELLQGRQDLDKLRRGYPEVIGDALKR